jgi:hypothetical protein
MCFTLYIGSDTALPQILWDKDIPGFHTRELEDWEGQVPSCFSHPKVIYVGSDQGCGCGFRHALLTDKEWIPVISEDEQEMDVVRNNHQALFDYVTSNIKDVKLEIFACWNGNVDGGPQSVEQIKCSDLINEQFYFKEGGLYTIVI